MNMNNLFKKSYLMLFALLSVLVMACSDDDEKEASPKPTITAVSPTSGAPGDAIVITGTNLADASAVTFGNASATIGSKSATSITTTVPTEASEGAQTITVTTPEGTANISFTVESSEEEVEAPTITAVDPAEGEAGTEVTITGTNLENAIVTFGEAVAVLSANTATSITTTVPEGAAEGEQEITVITAGGNATHAFTVIVGIPGEVGERLYVHRDGVELDNGFREHGGNDHHEPLDRANTEQAFEGESSIKFVSKKSPNAQFGFHLEPHGTIMDTEEYTHLVFSVYGGEGAGNMRVALREKQENGKDVAQANIVRVAVTPAIGEWTTFEIPLTSLGTKVGEGDDYIPSGQFGSIKWFEMMFDSHGTSEGGDIRTFYIDEIYFVTKE